MNHFWHFGLLDAWIITWLASLAMLNKTFLVILAHCVMKMISSKIRKTKFSSPQNLGLQKMIHFRIFSGFSLVSKLGLRFTLEYFALLLYSCLICKWYVALNHRFIINFQIDTNWRELLPFSTPPHRTHQFEFVRQSMFKVDIGLGPKLENWSLCCCPQYLASESQQEIHTFNGTSVGNKMWLAASIAHQKVLNQGKKVKILDFQPIQFQEFVPQNKLKCSVVKTRWCLS